MLSRIISPIVLLSIIAIALASAQQVMPPVGGVPVPLPGVPVDLPTAPATIAWTIDVPAAPVVSPLITADRVVVALLPGTIAGFDRLDGKLVWRVELNPGQPLASDGTHLFVHAGEAIHALRVADGSPVWQVPSDTLLAPPVVKEGWIVTATKGTLTARRTADGSTVWTVEAPQQRDRAAISGDVLYIPVAGGRVIARDLLTGAVKWERQLGGNAEEPLPVGDNVFVGASDRYFYSLKAASGEIDWQWRTGAAIRGRAALDGERVVFTAFDNVVRSHDRSSGSERWHKGVPFRPMAGPVVAAGAIFVAGPGTDVRILRASDGTPAGTITFPGRQALAPGVFETATGVVFAAVTGGLEETWKLSLTVPLPATLRPSR